VCDLETSKEEAKSPLKGCEYKPTMGCDAERKKNHKGAEWILWNYQRLFHLLHNPQDLYLFRTAMHWTLLLAAVPVLPTYQ